MDWFSIGYGLLPVSGVDRNYLDNVKTGFGGHGLGSHLELLVILAALTLAIVLLILVLSRWLKPLRLSFFKGRIDLIESPEKVRETVNCSIAARSVYEIEVFDEAYKETYKGVVLGTSPKGNVDIELSSYTDPNLDFKNKPLMGAFRISHRGKNEFYRFNATSLGIGNTDAYGRREKIIRLTMPLSMEKSQKRQYNRIEPAGRFGFAVHLLTADIAIPPIPLDNFKLAHKTVVRDISLGGLQVVMIARGDELKVAVDDEIFVHFRLPKRDLAVTDLEPGFILKVKVISVVRIPTGRRVMSQESDLRTSGPYTIKLQYLARGQINRQTKTVDFTPIGPLTLEDLGRWLQAYQRFLIQKEKDTLPQPDQVKNLYPRRPPDVAPKYPSIPFKKTENTETLEE